MLYALHKFYVIDGQNTRDQIAFWLMRIPGD